MEENNTDFYINYVNTAIAKFGKTSKLIQDDTITPESLNRALGEYLEVNLALLAEYQRAKNDEVRIADEYQQWYDRAFVDVKSRMNADSQKTAKFALKEYEIQLRHDYQKEYYEWSSKIKESQMKVRFLLRIVDLYKKYDNILTALSSNMRTEIRSLSLESRMNTDPDTASRNKVITSFPKERKVRPVRD